MARERMELNENMLDQVTGGIGNITYPCDSIVAVDGLREQFVKLLEEKRKKPLTQSR